MKRIALVALTGLLLAPALLSAQSVATQPTATPAAATHTLAQGLSDGRKAAEIPGMRGRMAGGFLVGFTTGLIGTGIMYFATGGSESDVPDYLANDAAGRGSEYLVGYRQGYAQKLRARRRSASLTGGLLGTVAGAALVLSVMNSEGDMYRSAPVFAVSVSTR